jgi:hypothetical protein
MPRDGGGASLARPAAPERAASWDWAGLLSHGDIGLGFGRRQRTGSSRPCPSNRPRGTCCLRES